MAEAKLGSRRGELDSTVIFVWFFGPNPKETDMPSLLPGSTWREEWRWSLSGDRTLTVALKPLPLPLAPRMPPRPTCRWCLALLAALPQVGGQCCLFPCLTYPPSCCHIFLVLSFYFFSNNLKTGEIVLQVEAMSI